jgi:DNA invertase Pin-like site-specific DNA recombinase
MVTPAIRLGERVGYARVSTTEQNPDLQMDALRAHGCSQVYTDAASGKDTARPELAYCLKALRKGDTLVVWRLDRLGRSLSDLVRVVKDLEGRGIAFESLSENIETSSANGRLVFHVFAALAEFERNLIRERTTAGLAAARARGRVGGRKAKLGEKEIREIKALLADPASQVKDIAARYGVSRTTLYKRVGVVTLLTTGQDQKAE